MRKKKLDAWNTVQRSHAIANGVFVAVINRVGIEDDLEFWGNSFVADPFGEVIARAGRESGRNAHRRMRPRTRSKRPGATGRSCATAASTRTAI